MPNVRVLLFREADGTVPLRDWLDCLPPEAIAKFLARLIRLEEVGRDLRRPEGDYLQDGIYELRARHLRMNYRMLYFFFSDTSAVVSHGFTKQQARVPPREIELARRRRYWFEQDPAIHAFENGDT